MFTLIVGNSSGDRVELVMDRNATPRMALDEAQQNITGGTLHLDGCALRPRDLDTPFAELGVGNRASLIAVVKGDGACV